MKRLVPAPLKLVPNFDPVVDFPADIERLVAAASNAGYTVTPHDVAELWRRHAGDVCASWFAVDGDDRDILVAQLKHAEIQLDSAVSPSPPTSYLSWLESDPTPTVPKTEIRPHSSGNQLMSVTYVLGVKSIRGRVSWPKSKPKPKPKPNYKLKSGRSSSQNRHFWRAKESSKKPSHIGWAFCFWGFGGSIVAAKQTIFRPAPRRTRIPNLAIKGLAIANPKRSAPWNKFTCGT